MHSIRFEMQSSNITNALKKINHKKHGRWGDSKKDHSHTSIYIKPIPCVEKYKKRKVAQSGGYRILFNCSNSKSAEKYV